MCVSASECDPDRSRKQKRMIFHCVRSSRDARTMRATICVLNVLLVHVIAEEGARNPKGHTTVLFGLIKQVCPRDPIPELGDIKACSKDSDCSPRICCPDEGGEGSHCRTPQPLWEELSPRFFVEPIKGAISYVQCTPPPPPLWDLSPKPCETPLDCFPNLCCQEGGKRHCRPPKRSILTLIAEIGQKIVPTEVAREFIKKIS